MAHSLQSAANATSVAGFSTAASKWLISRLIQHGRVIQYFTGWLIRNPDDAFDPSAATMFDFRVPQRNELRFCYVLPLSKRQALIEFVALSSHRAESTLEGHVRHTLNLRDYRILEEEGGVSPSDPVICASH
ncbi:MAG: lycopene cyclase family protein [Anaerolineae bacterium]